MELGHTLLYLICIMSLAGVCFGGGGSGGNGNGGMHVINLYVTGITQKRKSEGNTLSDPRLLKNTYTNTN